MKKKILSIMLCLCMVLTLMPTVSLANESGEGIEQAPAIDEITPVTLLVNQSTGDDTAVRAAEAVYKTINGAIAAAQDGDTIKLEAGFTASGFAIDINAKKLTFDYAGHTVNCGGAAGFKCAGTADLTIVDSSEGKTGALNMTKAGSLAGLYVYGTARVVVRGGCIDGTQCTGNPTNRSLAVWNCGVDAYVLLDDGRYKGYIFGNSLQTNPLAFIRFTPEQRTHMGEGFLGMLNPGWYGYELGEGQVSLTEDLTGLMVIVERGKELTIDLKGHNMASQNYNAYISPGAELTVKNTGAYDEGSGKIYCSNEANPSTHNFFNGGSLTLEGDIHIINRMTDTRFAPVYMPESNTALTVNHGVTIDSTGCAVLANAGAENSTTTINGGVFNCGVTPIQNNAGTLTINGGTFNGTGNPNKMSGVYVGDYTESSPVAFVGGIRNAAITARDGGVFIDPAVGGEFTISNTTINVNSTTPAAYTIENLSDCNIVVTGRDTYFNCTNLYLTSGERAGNNFTGTGTLSITAGVYSVDPTEYVDLEKYMVLPYSGNTEHFIVLPRRSSSGSSSTPSQNVPVIVDGGTFNIGTAKTEDKVTTVTVNQTELKKQLDAAHETVIVPVVPEKNADTAVAQLVVENVEEMASKEMTLSVKIDDVSYDMRAIAIDTKELMKELGATDPTKVPVGVMIKELPNSAVTLENGSLILPPISFTVTATYGGKTVEVEVFEKYVQRVIEIPGNVDAGKITTAVVTENGTQRHVPTEVFKNDGKWCARINSLTNSTYALINHEVNFADAKGKWFEAVVNEMAGREIINGRAEGIFDGEAYITRAEFAAILVRALGLPQDGNASTFTDVAKTAWYYGAVGKAYEYGLINGRDAQHFDPTAQITRQEAMAMIHRAADITEFTGTVGTLSKFSDADSIGAWALTDAQWNVGSGLIQGNSNSMICGQDNITRGETATIILRLLQKSELVDVRAQA